LGLFRNLPTLPGPGPAAVATPVEVEKSLESLDYSNDLEGNHLPKEYLNGVGQGGDETPCCLRIFPSFFMSPQGFNKTNN